MDVHKEATTIAVMNSAGKLVMESIVETKAATIMQFFEGAAGLAVRDVGRRDMGWLGCTTCRGRT